MFVKLLKNALAEPDFSEVQREREKICVRNWLSLILFQVGLWLDSQKIFSFLIQES